MPRIAKIYKPGHIFPKAPKVVLIQQFSENNEQRGLFGCTYDLPNCKKTFKASIGNVKSGGNQSCGCFKQSWIHPCKFTQEMAIAEAISCGFVPAASWIYKNQRTIIPGYWRATGHTDGKPRLDSLKVRRKEGLQEKCGCPDCCHTDPPHRTAPGKLQAELKTYGFIAELKACEKKGIEFKIDAIHSVCGRKCNPIIARLRSGNNQCRYCKSHGSSAFERWLAWCLSLKFEIGIRQHIFKNEPRIECDITIPYNRQAYEIDGGRHSTKNNNRKNKAAKAEGWVLIRIREPKNWRQRRREILTKKFSEIITSQDIDLILNKPEEEFKKWERENYGGSQTDRIFKEFENYVAKHHKRPKRNTKLGSRVHIYVHTFKVPEFVNLWNTLPSRKNGRDLCSKPFKDIESGQVFYTLLEAATAIGVRSTGNLCLHLNEKVTHLNKKITHIAGHKFIYLNGEEKTLALAEIDKKKIDTLPSACYPNSNNSQNQ